jgi:hypothetical protein
VKVTKENLDVVQKVLNVVREWSGETEETDGSAVVLSSPLGTEFSVDELYEALWVIEQLKTDS